MLDITFDEFNNLQFSLFDGNPIIKRYGVSGVVADPSVLTPSESADGKWHLFCHTVLGVYHYESADGIEFVNKGKIVGDAMRPDINYIDGIYYLYFERVQPLVKRGLAAIGVCKWFSEIYLTKSKDLISWSEPVRAIGFDKDYQDSGKLGSSVSNPFLIKIGDKYRLYFSAGLSYLDDCHFSEPTHISYAESASPDGPFVSRETPVLSPDKNVDGLNRGCGCIKVYRLSDVFIGLINGIYIGDDGKSHSAVMLFRSDDGDKFEYVKHLVCPEKIGENDWMAQYVYASNLAVFDGEARIYFNARDKANPISGKENIGVTVAKL